MKLINTYILLVCATIAVTLLRQFLAERFFGSCVIRNILDQ